MIQACNFSIQEAKVEGLMQIEANPGLHSRF